MVEEWLAVLQKELHHARLGAAFLAGGDGGLAYEIGFGEINCEAEACIDDIVLGGDIVTEVAEGFLDTAAVHCVHATKLEAEGLASGMERLKSVACHVCAYIDLPTKLSHI